MKRHGWTVHEMLISLSVMSATVGLAAHAAVGQLRFVRGVGDVLAVRANAGEVGSVLAGALWGVSAALGDIRAATDSAIEIVAPIGAAVVCSATPGRVTIAATAARGNALAAFDAPAQPGDDAHMLLTDSAGSTWLRVTIVGASAADGACAAFPQVAASQELLLQQPFLVPAGAVVRVTRPMRLSHYRASDGWYFGVRDWNGGALRLNTIQPVAGPLEPHSDDPTRSGLVLRYYDDAAQELPPPVALDRIARVDVVVRARARRPVNVAGLAGASAGLPDSSIAIIGLRNAR